MTLTLAVLFVIFPLVIMGFAFFIKTEQIDCNETGRSRNHSRFVTVGLIVSTTLAVSFLILYFLNLLPKLPKTIVYLYEIITIATGLFFGVKGLTRGIYWATIILVLNTLIIFIIILGLLITSM
jgi:hypothetical protein